MFSHAFWLALPAGRLFVRRWQPAAIRHDAPIALFHDSLGCVELWRGFPARLAEHCGREVIAYDRWGFGRSDPRPGALPLDFIQEEAERHFPAIRQRLGLERFVAFGHSVGGAMAALCAAQAREDCEALITESAQAFVEERTLAGIREADAELAQPGQLQRLAKYHGDKAGWVLRNWVDTWLHPGFAGWDLRQALPEVRCPLLALHGEHDEYGSRRHPESYVAHAGGPASLHLLPNTRHVPHREREEEVLTHCRRFLDALPATSAAA